MSVKLNLEDRYYISMYSRKLPCTIMLRFAIDKFLDQIEINSEEMSKYDVKIDPSTLTFQCNDPDYVVEYESFPENLITSVKLYIKNYDHESNKNSVMLQKSFKYLKKLL